MIPVRANNISCLFADERAMFNDAPASIGDLSMGKRCSEDRSFRRVTGAE